MNTIRAVLLSGLLALTLSACSDDSGDKKTAQPVEEGVFTVSGSLTPASNSDYDSDMQPRVGTIALDGSIKALNNPVILGGYLSGRAGFYSSDNEDDRENFDVDAQDRYVIALAANQQIRLSVFFADEDAVDQVINVRLRLRAEDASEDEVLQELTVDRETTLSLTVVQSGSTIIQLDAMNASGPVLYTLTVSEPVGGSALPQDSFSMSSDFVPGEVIVQLKSPQSMSSASVDSQKRVSEKFSQRHALQKLRGIARNAELYFLAGSSAPMQRASIQGIENWPERQRRKWQTLQVIEALKQDPEVLYAEPNFIRKAAAVPNDPLYNRQWSLPMLDLPAAWDLTQGQGVTVAVLDTGVDTGHLDLIDNLNLADGYDFVSNPTSAGDGNGRDSDPFDLDPNNHGTHVAGIIAAVGDNARGMTGVAHAATIMPLRVLGADGNGSDADVAAAIYYAAGLSNAGGVLPSRRADIINLSLGSTDVSTTMANAINAAIDEGVIVVAAAGNNGNDELFYPAAHERVIAVSSVTDHKTLSSFSNFGTFIDVAAPGGGDYLNDGFQGGILSTLYASEYGELMGTSMAAPHVSGVIALMLARQDTLNLTQLRARLASGELTENIGATDRFGAGLINAAKALSALGEEIPDQLNFFPTQLSFIGAQAEAVLTLSNPGSGNVTATMTASEGWLDLVPVSGQVDENGLGRYEVNINRADPDLPLIGSVTAFITVQSSINDVPQPSQRIDVFVSNSAASQDHVGQLYIYLLRKQEVDEAEEGDTIQLYASVNGAYNTTTRRYDFNITDVEPGEYYLEASTDNDGDYYVYDQGEARGAYPLRALPTTITVSDRNLSGLNFEVAYDALAESSGMSQVSRLLQVERVGQPRRVTR